METGSITYFLEKLRSNSAYPPVAWSFLTRAGVRPFRDATAKFHSDLKTATTRRTGGGASDETRTKQEFKALVQSSNAQTFEHALGSVPFHRAVFAAAVVYGQLRKAATEFLRGILRGFSDERLKPVEEMHRQLPATVHLLFHVFDYACLERRLFHEVWKLDASVSYRTHEETLDFARLVAEKIKKLHFLANGLSSKLVATVLTKLDCDTDEMRGLDNDLSLQPYILNKIEPTLVEAGLLYPHKSGQHFIVPTSKARDVVVKIVRTYWPFVKNLTHGLSWEQRVQLLRLLCSMRGGQETYQPCWYFKQQGISPVTGISFGRVGKLGHEVVSFPDCPFPTAFGLVSTALAERSGVTSSIEENAQLFDISHALSMVRPVDPDEASVLSLLMNGSRASLKSGDAQVAPEEWDQLCLMLHRVSQNIDNLLRAFPAMPLNLQMLWDLDRDICHVTKCSSELDQQ